MIPKRLFKFESLNTMTTRNLKNAQIFFNTPASFNDPFDCSTLESSVSLNDTDIVSIFNQFIKHQNIKLSTNIKNRKDIPEKDIEKLLSGLKAGLAEKQQNWRYKTGCTCFSSDNLNILMWSHYADSHKGICLEFDTSFEPFSKAKEVKYSNKFPSISPMKLLGYEKDLNDELLKPLLTKYKHWQYEKEWRIFHKEPNKSFGYEVNSLKAVYFGSEVNDTDVEIICLILQGQCENIKFFKMIKDKSSYQLSFEQFSYIPNITIKHNKIHHSTCD